jgi:hypothetical protein
LYTTPRCLVLLDSPKARLQAVYWSPIGMQTCNAGEMQWLMQLCLILHRLLYPVDIIRMILEIVKWSDIMP